MAPSVAELEQTSGEAVENVAIQVAKLNVKQEAAKEENESVKKDVSLHCST